MKIILHNASHDIPILAELFDIPVETFLRRISFDDTMLAAYCLRLLPQGLKPLSRRFSSMSMSSYPEIVADADQRIAIDYLKGLLRHLCVKCDGAGELVETPVGAKGKLLAPRPVKCDQCEGDGTAWPPPDEQMVYENGKVRIARGWRIGRRVRGILKGVDNAECAGSVDVSGLGDRIGGIRSSGSDSSSDVLGSEVDVRARWQAIDYEYRLKIEDVAGPMREVSLDDVVPQSVAVNYSARDADATVRIHSYLSAQLDAEGLRPIYEINRNALPLLIRMMDVGTYVDVPYLRKLDARLEVESDKILYELEQEVGHYVNPASSKQVAELLFDEMKLPVVKETKTGDASTQDKVLEDLKIQVAGWTAASNRDRTRNERAIRVLTAIGDYRERHKLRGTYTLALPRTVDGNSRIHTTFKSTRTETNRLSSAEPNLQNIPARTGLGRLVRGAFSAPPGYSLIAVDYGQIEVRAIAHLSKDQYLCEGLHAGLDVHYVTASRVFHVPLDAVTKQQRMVAKSITFLILYGGGALRLRAELKLQGIEVSEAEAQSYIDAYLTVAYPGIQDYMFEQHAHARRYGYVEDIFGWRRYLPGVHSAINGVRAEAERMAVNAPSQSMAGGIMKLACPVLFDEVLPYVRKKGYDCDFLLTVHDEFVAQVQLGGEQLMLDATISAMTGVVKLDVPLTADGKFGHRWSELK